MGLAGVGKETVEIATRGSYALPSGATVSFGDAVERAIRGTKLYTPDDFAGLDLLPFGETGPTAIEVTGETTGEAARRLVEREGTARVVALNFASAKNPGGGFLSNAKAQEEDLARCSALYACLVTQPAFYSLNRASGSMLYTDHLIYSPDVPFFRDERLELLAKPFAVSILTSPAPNAGEALKRNEGGRPAIRATLERRAEQVLLVAAAEGHTTLVLGAWGCGVFRNDPAEVAGVFARLLQKPRFARAFTRIVFAVYDRSAGRENFGAFESLFSPRRPA